MNCNKCGGAFSTRPSDFPGWDVLACVECARPIKLLPKTGPRPRSGGPQRRADVNRAMRAARRMKMRQQPWATG